MCLTTSPPSLQSAAPPRVADVPAEPSSTPPSSGSASDPPPPAFFSGSNPGEFEDVEDAKSFRVQELDGAVLMLITMLGPNAHTDKEPVMAQLQYQIGANSADAAFILHDTRSPVRAGWCACC